MKTVNIYEAKTHLSSLVDQAAAGTDIIIARAGRPLVRLTKLERGKRKIKYGVLKGRIKVPAGFDEPLPPEIQSMFE